MAYRFFPFAFPFVFLYQVLSFSHQFIFHHVFHILTRRVSHPFPIFRTSFFDMYEHIYIDPSFILIFSFFYFLYCFVSITCITLSVQVAFWVVSFRSYSWSLPGTLVCNFVFNFAWYVFRSQVVDRNRALTIDLQRERAERQRLQGHLVAAERGAHGTHSEYLKGTVDALEVLILRSITSCVARGFDGF